ncbi:MAG: HNH endonuclease signature motif containing protein [Burkholderiales bacterium]
MQMIRGNDAIFKHQAKKKRLLLFEYVAKDQVRFLGEVEYLGHPIEERADRNDDLRDAFIFHLGFLPPISLGQVEQATNGYANSTQLSSKLSLSELRGLVLESIASDATLEQKRANVTCRTEAIRRYALLRASGTCEGCKVKAPFRSKRGPYLEVHHVFRLADGVPEHPANVVALCPNCHRHAHYSDDAVSFNARLIEWLATREQE